MALTRYRNGATIFTEDVANALFGGLYGSAQGQALPSTDPRVAGHVHDGQHKDGHAQKINLTDHVTGTLSGTLIQDYSISENKIVGSVLAGTYLKIFQDAAERLSDVSTYEEEQIYRKALQVDTMVEYVLTDISPVTWTALGENMAVSYYGLGMSNTYPIQVGNAFFTYTTVTFPAAPEDLIVKRLDISQISLDDTGAVNENNNLFCVIDEIRINSSAIDIVGLGIAQIYTEFAERPIDLNLPLSEGDLLEIDISFTKNTFANVTLLYLPQETALPDSNYFIGPAANPTITASAVYATGTLTINSAPLSSPGAINFSNLLYGLDEVTLSPAGGARTSGSNNFDNTIGTTGGIATEIAAAINDGSNDFGTFVTASALSNVVTLTSVLPGPIGNYYLASESFSEVSYTSFSGGSMPTATTVTMVAAPANGIITGLTITAFNGNDIDNALCGFISINELKINGGANLLAGKVMGNSIHPLNNNNAPVLNIPIELGDIVTLSITNSYYVSLIVLPNLIVKYEN